MVIPKEIKGNTVFSIFDRWMDLSLAREKSKSTTIMTVLLKAIVLNMR